MIEAHDLPHNGAIALRVEAVRARIALAAQRSGRDVSGITLIGVTKTVPAECVHAAALAGIVDLGENRVQEAVQKLEALKSVPHLRWHLIGGLQRNKVRRAVEIFDSIHSIDSLELAQAVAAAAAARAGGIEVFAQVNTSGESSKSGFSHADLLSVAPALAALPQLRWKGLMTIAPLSPDQHVLRNVFRETRALQQQLVAVFNPTNWNSLSMGMSGDFEVAIEEGATHVRVGRALFGERTVGMQG